MQHHQTQKVQQIPFQDGYLTMQGIITAALERQGAETVVVFLNCRQSPVPDHGVGGVAQMVDARLAPVLKPTDFFGARRLRLCQCESDMLRQTSPAFFARRASIHSSEV